MLDRAFIGVPYDCIRCLLLDRLLSHKPLDLLPTKFKRSSSVVPHCRVTVHLK